MNTTLKILSLPVSYLPRSGPVVRRLAPQSGLARQRFRGGACFELDLSDRIQAESFVRRSYERQLCRWIVRRVGRPGDLFVDVGANVGLVSLAVAVETGIRVLAFEPNPTNCMRWRRNRELNPDAQAELVEAAVGDCETTVRLAMPRGGESGWGRVADEGIEVPQVRLDDRIEAATVLKIDVEGYEPAVLRGAERLLSERRVGAVVCEVQGFDTEETVKLLAEYGYEPAVEIGMDQAFIPR